MMNTQTLGDGLINLTGVDATDVRLALRRLREAGLMPVIPRGRETALLPQIAPLHAVVAVLGIMAGGPQLRVANTVRKLFSLPLADDPNDLLGLRLLGCVVDAVNSGGKSTDSFKLNIAQRHLYASIMYADGRTEHFIDPATPRLPQWPIPIVTVAAVDHQLFLELGALLGRVRALAVRMGVTIECDETWRALGYEPPEEMFPTKPLVPLSGIKKTPSGPKGGGRPGKRANAAHA